MNTNDYSVLGQSVQDNYIGIAPRPVVSLTDTTEETANAVERALRLVEVIEVRVYGGTPNILPQTSGEPMPRDLISRAQDISARMVAVNSRLLTLANRLGASDPDNKTEDPLR